jgi:hypothetical protein
MSLFRLPRYIHKMLTDAGIRPMGVGIIALIAVTGTILTLSSRAATLTTSTESESGVLSGQAKVITDATASNNQAVQFAAAAGGTCTVSATLVNSCRPWLGAWASQYSEVGADVKSQLLGHEQRIGRELDIVHTYHTVGSNTLSSADIYFANRANTILMTNWKPAAVWADADGSDANVNASIDQMANSVKSLGSKKIMLVVFHEPENDVTSDPNCPNIAYKGSAGTPADYRAMWANVRSRFNAAGVTNVVWVMNYMGFETWDCLVKDLWPGNANVDWLAWDPYSGTNTQDWDESVSRAYDMFEQTSDASHNFVSKPWALGEFGIGHGNTQTADQAHTYLFYDDAKAGLDTNKYPRLKAYINFDAQGMHDTQIAYVTTTHVYDAVELQHYQAFAQDPRFTDAFYEQ